MAIENATNAALRVLRPAIEGKFGIVDVKRDAEISYMAKIQDALQKMVWSTGGSHNWYTKDVNGKRFNGMTYPWWQGHYWWSCLFPVWKDFEFQGKGGPSAIRKRRSKWWLVCLGLVLSGLWAKRNPSSPVLVALMTAALRVGMLRVPGTGVSLAQLVNRASSLSLTWKA